MNGLNDDIKTLEKEHQAQVDHLSSQKRWVNVRIFGYMERLMYVRRRERRKRSLRMKLQCIERIDRVVVLTGCDFFNAKEYNIIYVSPKTLC